MGDGPRARHLQEVVRDDKSRQHILGEVDTHVAQDLGIAALDTEHARGIDT
jgi:hypothetical protein